MPPAWMADSSTLLRSGPDSLLAVACAGRNWSSVAGFLCIFPTMSTPAVIKVPSPRRRSFVSAEELERAGAHAGDRVRVENMSRRPIRSMLGAGVEVAGPPAGFDEDDLSALRRAMAEGLGDDLTA